MTTETNIQQEKQSQLIDTLSDKTKKIVINFTQGQDDMGITFKSFQHLQLSNEYVKAAVRHTEHGAKIIEMIITPAWNKYNLYFEG